MGRHDRIGVFFDYTIFDTDAFEIVGQDVFRKVRLLLVQINGEYLKFYGCTPLNIQQQIKHRKTVFSTRKTDHHLVALLDHREISDRIAHLFEQFGLCLRFSYQRFSQPPKIMNFDTPALK